MDTKRETLFKLFVGAMAGLFAGALMGPIVGVAIFVLVASVVDIKS